MIYTVIDLHSRAVTNNEIITSNVHRSEQNLVTSG